MTKQKKIKAWAVWSKEAGIIKTVSHKEIAKAYSKVVDEYLKTKIIPITITFNEPK